MAERTATLPVLFTTHTPYSLPVQKFMIPASWKRYQLSQLVNEALALAQPVPFDFILKKTGELLRVSLKEWCESNGIGMEETLEIEYVKSLLPPTRVAGIPHDDWVSDVSCGLQGHFVTASYDGLLRVFDASQVLVHTISGHTAPVTSICVLSTAYSGAGDSDDVILASTSHDATARLMSYHSETKSSQALASLHLHTSPVSSIASSPSGSHLLTSGWDALIGLWDTQVPSTDEIAAPLVDKLKTRKRRRLAADRGSASGPKRKAPLAVLKSHTGRVTATIFSPVDEKRAYSVSLDATLRSWDIDSGVCLYTHTVPESPFLALAHLSAPHLLAATSIDRDARVFDTRILSSSSSLNVSTPIVLQHPSTPSSLARSPTNEHHIASGGYDGVVRIWDVRSAKGAIASFRAGEGVEVEERGDAKVLGLDWKGGVMAVGGEAGLDIWRVPERAQKAR